MLKGEMIQKNEVSNRAAESGGLHRLSNKDFSEGVQRIPKASQIGSP